MANKMLGKVVAGAALGGASLLVFTPGIAFADGAQPGGDREGKVIAKPHAVKPGETVKLLEICPTPQEHAYVWSKVTGKVKLKAADEGRGDHGGKDKGGSWEGDKGGSWEGDKGGDKGDDGKGPQPKPPANGGQPPAGDAQPPAGGWGGGFATDVAPDRGGKAYEEERADAGREDGKHHWKGHEYGQEAGAEGEHSWKGGDKRGSYGGESGSYGGESGSYGSDKYGSESGSYGGESGSYGSDKYGSESGSYGGESGSYGSDKYGSDKYSSDKYGSEADSRGYDKYGQDAEAGAEAWQGHGAEYAEDAAGAESGYGWKGSGEDAAGAESGSGWKGRGEDAAAAEAERSWEHKKDFVYYGEAQVAPDAAPGTYELKGSCGEGELVVLPRGGVEGGDGGMTTTGTDRELALGGAGMIGAAALGGIVLMRRRRADGLV
ncbi:hypothetical protein ACPFP2_15655 [Micromonospora citrea]|uniref:hypothetical protein n=1 Tax=Micromonospora citrea TaxID=47855 RepID=UPI003C3C1699